VRAEVLDVVTAVLSHHPKNTSDPLPAQLPARQVLDGPFRPFCHNCYNLPVTRSRPEVEKRRQHEHGDEREHETGKQRVEHILLDDVDDDWFAGRRDRDVVGIQLNSDVGRPLVDLDSVYVGSAETDIRKATYSPPRDAGSLMYRCDQPACY
jgi:hypothetical protein